MASAANRDVLGYNYERFSLRHRTMDHLGGVGVGEPAPDFTATRLDGTKVVLADHRGTPLVLETASVTCPMYEGRIEPMNALARRYPEVRFLVLYVREAHPGQRIGPHRSLAQKTAAARRTVNEDGEHRTILVDDLTGTAHRQLGAMPNTVHVIDAQGTVRFRAMWNDPDAVDTALRRLLAGRDTAAVPAARFRPVEPATMLRVLRRAGTRAIWDFAKAFPAVARWHLRSVSTTETNANTRPS